MGAEVKFGPLGGHLAVPGGQGPHPGLLVIQEWWGLDDQTRSIADRFAAQGYLAFAPDIYHGELAALGDMDTARRLVTQYGPGAPAELAAAFDGLRAHPGCSGKIGSVGFCFGGRMSLALATLRPVDAVCTFYGGGMQQLFPELRQVLKAPVLGLFGDADVSIPPGTIEEFKRLLEEVGVEHEVIVYPESGHAFFRDSDPKVYRPEASRDAWTRVQAFFARHLG